MGAHFWSYHIPYQEDIAAALQALREREFRAGRFYQPTTVQPGFFGRVLGRPPLKPNPPKNIREALKISDATGTRSILDMDRISAQPELGSVSPLPASKLQQWFGTEQPTRAMVEQNEELTEDLDRGLGIYLITYQKGKPDGIYFAGYSFD